MCHPKDEQVHYYSAKIVMYATQDVKRTKMIELMVMGFVSAWW